jgi:hypothetical protein
VGLLVADYFLAQVERVFEVQKCKRELRGLSLVELWGLSLEVVAAGSYGRGLSVHDLK